MKTKTDWRLDGRWPIPVRRLAEAEGYSMVRYKGAAVRLIETKDWDRYIPCDHNGKVITPSGEA